MSRCHNAANSAPGPVPQPGTFAGAFRCKWTHVPVNETGDHPGIDGCNGGRLCRRKHSSVNPSQDYDDQKDTPNGITSGFGDFLPAGPVAFRQVCQPGDHVDTDHQHHPGGQSREYACQEHASNRNLHGGCIDDHDNRRGNQNSECAGIADHTRRKFLAVAGLAHARDRDCTDRHHCCG